MPIAEDWLQYRELIQSEARRLLGRANKNPEIRLSLQELIANSEFMRSPAYQEKIDFNTDITIRLIMRLNRLLTAEQRDYLLIGLNP